MATKTTQLHFSRFEFKYVLPRAIREDLEAELLYFIELDPYVESQPGQKYLVRSLYFDNRQMACYYEKIDGVMHRAKFRLRTYSADDDGQTPQFLEIKGRYNALVFKHRSPLRQPLESGDGQRLFASDDRLVHDVVERLEDSPIRAQFLRDHHRKRYRPTLLVDYLRRPYISKYDPEFRLTFDDNLSCCATQRLFPRPHEGQRSVLPGYTILEVKFRHHVPRWFHRIIQAFELRRVSISKYCAGVEAYGLAPKLE